LKNSELSVFRFFETLLLEERSWVYRQTF
jgi:hypothetical protein